MAKFIVTGTYSSDAMKGMIQNPTDREAATRALVEAAGGKMEHFLLTTGATDFLIIVTIDDASGLIPGLMVAGASGMVTQLQTAQAFTSDEFTTMQKKAGGIASAYATTVS